MQLAACALLMFLSATAAPPTIQLERPAWKQEFDEANRAYKSGELAKAEQGFRKALISAKNGEKPELARAFVLNGLVAALVAREAYAEAEPLAAEAAELWTKTQGFEHPTVGRTYSNLGNIRRALKDFDGAESAYRQSLTCLNRVLPKNHPDMLLTLAKLADLHFDLGEDDKAIQLYRRMLLMQTSGLSTEAAGVATTLNRLARCHLRRGEVREAEPLARQALEIAQRNWGEEHRLYAESLATMAIVYSQQGNATQATQTIDQAVEKVEEPARGRWELEAIRGRILQQAGDNAAALSALQRAVELLPKLPAPSKNLAELYSLYAEALTTAGREQLAAQMSDRAAEIHQSLQRKRK